MSNLPFEEQVKQIQSCFINTVVTLEVEGGCRFLHLPSFIEDPNFPNQFLDALFACDNHLGYPSRLWIQKQISTVETRNWNNVNTYILGKNWSAFSFKAQGETLLEKLLSHMRGLK